MVKRYGNDAMLEAAARADQGGPLQLPFWSVIPFIVLLLAIALLPLVAGHFWESNRNKAIVAAIISVPVALYLIGVWGEAGMAALLHEMSGYGSFIILLASLYTVSGGIALDA